MNLKSNSRNIILTALLFCIFSLVSCNIDSTPTSFEEGEPASISFTVSMSSIESLIENGAPATKAGAPNQEEYNELLSYIESNKFYSFSLALAKVDVTNPANSRIVAYRNFVKNSERPGANGKKYFYYNVSDARNHQGTPLVSVPLESVGRYYTDNKDDTQFNIPATYGENGFFDDNSVIKATFNYDHPAHGDTERLTTGRYAICLVANFDESSLISYNHTSGNHIAHLVQHFHDHMEDSGFIGIGPLPEADDDYDEGYYRGYNAFLFSWVTLDGSTIEYYNSETGTYQPNPITDPITGFPKHDIEHDRVTSDSYIRKKDEIILASHGQYIDIKPGNNHFDFTLDRDLARVTVVVNNQSGVPIQVDTLGFCEHFTSAATHVFEPDNSAESFVQQELLLNWRGAPKVTSDRAIVPFDETQTYSVVGESHVIFDALTLASGDVEPFYMSIGVTVPSVTVGNKREFTALNNTISQQSVLLAELNDESVWPTGKERYFMIQTNKSMNGVNPFIRGIQGQRPLRDLNVHNHGFAYNKAIADQDSSYMWVLKKVDVAGAKKVIIRNLKYDGWIVATGNANNGNTFIYTDNENDAQKFDITWYTGNVAETVCFTSQYGGVDIYLHVLNDAQGMTTLSRWNDAGSHFRIYELAYEFIAGEVLRKHATIPMYSFDKVTGVAVPLKSIKRNQHINIEVTVRYNPTSQELDFHVIDWQNSNNTVIFE